MEDDFLGGRLRIRQADFRAGHDSVLLGGFAPEVKGEGMMLDVGSGAGTVLCVYGERVRGCGLLGLERDERAVRLARENGRRNGYGERMWCVRGDILEGCGGLKEGSVWGVMMNPPYWDEGEGLKRVGAEGGARTGDAEVGVYVEACVRVLKNGGWLSVIYPARKILGVLSVMGSHLGALEVVPVHGKVGSAARVMLVRGKKLSKKRKGEIVWCRPLFMHKEDGSPSEEAEEVTREGRFPEGIVRKV